MNLPMRKLKSSNKRCEESKNDNKTYDHLGRIDQAIRQLYKLTSPLEASFLSDDINIEYEIIRNINEAECLQRFILYNIPDYKAIESFSILINKLKEMHNNQFMKLLAIDESINMFIIDNIILYADEIFSQIMVRLYDDEFGVISQNLFYSLKLLRNNYKERTGKDLLFSDYGCFSKITSEICYYKQFISDNLAELCPIKIKGLEILEYLKDCLYDLLI